MALPRDYNGQSCSLARTLEIVGERWTLLILRDAFFGVRRFGDFVARLDIPRAVLTERLKALATAGILMRVPGEQGRDEYQLTDKGTSLWPTVRTLMAWGDTYYAPAGPRRAFLHAADDAPIDTSGRCTGCGVIVDATDTIVIPGPGLPAPTDHDDPVTVALSGPHRLLEPVRVATAR